MACAGVNGKNYGVDESIFNLNRLQFVHLAPDKLYSCSLVPNFDTLHCLVMAKLSGNKNVKECFFFTIYCHSKNFFCVGLELSF